MQRTNALPANHRPRPPPLDPAAALFLDVDGTLLEIAAAPDQVRVPPELSDVLDRLAQERDGALALISGRRLADLDRLLRPWRGAAAGLHGGERRRADGTVEFADDPAAAAALAAARRQLAALARDLAGLRLEDKGLTVALHYRGAPRHQAAIIAAIEPLARPPLRVIHGKMVVELQPRGSDKGRAIAAFLAEEPFRGRRAVYVGDDATDEDAFAEVNRRGGISVLVGAPGATAAGYRLASVAAALAWLAPATPPQSLPIYGEGLGRS